MNTTRINEKATRPEAKENLFFWSAKKKIGRFTKAAIDINPPSLF